MKKLRCIIVLVFMMILLSVPITACWMYLSLEDMDEGAEMVVIARYEGEKEEVLLDNDFSGGLGATYWTMNNEVLIKGESKESIEVVTGGSSLSKNILSTDYQLTLNGKDTLLLFLTEGDDGRYHPLSPAAVIPLKKTENGKILGKYELVRTSNDFTVDELNHLLEEHNIEFVEKDGEMTVKSNHPFPMSILIIVLSIMCSLAFIKLS